MNKKYLAALLLIVLALSGLTFAYFKLSERNFSTKTVLIKMNIPLGSEALSNIKILNTDDKPQSFRVYFENLDGMAFASEPEFSISPGEEKKIDITFRDATSEIKVYSGYFVINSGKSKMKIPIILTAEDSRSFFSIIQSGIPDYENVYRGGKLGIDVKVYYLGAGQISQNIRAKYSIQDFDGNILWSNEGDLSVGATWSEIVPIVNSWKKGDYVFVTEINYNGVKTLSGHLFSIEGKKHDFFSSNIYIIFVIVLVFIIGTLIVFFAFAKSHDNLLIQLKKQQSEEVNRNVSLLNRTKSELSKAKNLKDKIKKIKDIEIAKKRIIKQIKEKQKRQISEFKKLKKSHKKPDALKKQINSWKNQGYNLDGIEKEIKKISGKGILKEMKKLKGQGYKI